MSDKKQEHTVLKTFDLEALPLECGEHKAMLIVSPKEISLNQYEADEIRKELEKYYDKYNIMVIRHPVNYASVKKEE